ncbi:MAG: GntR family transcriptional regulator [Sphingomonas sp.]|uniref:GntR family transcriptional regulator n=1 Tax=Sphingomonas sp. TaxID=28214 RepID=UPI00262927E7|nr:GntR family transcriptional regulator [Sphingomonas sp.]MDK2768453.1 GntR family transcriptional regulator [Sphingomonas sp.]
MGFSIDPHATRPIYVQIMDEVRRLIALGDLRADDPLPSVRQLAADLRVNHNTIVQAYRELERDDVVYVRRGQGTYVAAQREPAVGRAKLLGQVAERAATDAHRYGFTTQELIAALAQTPDAKGDANA